MIDGYGLSLSSLDQIKANGTTLIISVDCGVNALEEIEAINAMGMEIIITDHHNPRRNCLKRRRSSIPNCRAAPILSLIWPESESPTSC